MSLRIIRCHSCAVLILKKKNIVQKLGFFWGGVVKQSMRAKQIASNTRNRRRSRRRRP